MFRNISSICIFFLHFFLLHSTFITHWNNHERAQHQNIISRYIFLFFFLFHFFPLLMTPSEMRVIWHKFPFILTIFSRGKHKQNFHNNFPFFLLSAISDIHTTARYKARYFLSLILCIANCLLISTYSLIYSTIAN